MHLCQNSSCVCLFTTLLLEMHKKKQKSRKVFLGNDYIDKIKIITKYGAVSIGSSWLTKTFIGVFYSKKAKNGLF